MEYYDVFSEILRMVRVMYKKMSIIVYIYLYIDIVINFYPTHIRRLSHVPK